MTDSKTTRDARASEVALDLARVHAIALELARCHDDAIVRDLVRDLARAGSLALDLDFVRDLVRDVSLVRDLVRDVSLVRDLVRDVIRDRDRDRDRVRVRVRDRDLHLSSTLEVAYGRAIELFDRVAGLARAEESVAPFEVVRVSRVAVRVSGFAARLLPRADRDRYAEEYESELYELARISRRAQWVYAARLVVRSPLLRRELRWNAPGAVPGR